MGREALILILWLGQQTDLSRYQELVLLFVILLGCVLFLISGHVIGNVFFSVTVADVAAGRFAGTVVSAQAQSMAKVVYLCVGGVSYVEFAMMFELTFKGTVPC